MSKETDTTNGAAAQAVTSTEHERLRDEIADALRDRGLHAVKAAFAHVDRCAITPFYVSHQPDKARAVARYLLAAADALDIVRSES